MRAGVFASVCVVLSQAGHDLVASRPVPVWAGWTALGAVTAIGYCLAGRRRSAWWILLAVEIVQVCLHLWFSCCTRGSPGADLGHLNTTMPGGVHQVGSADMTMAHGGGMSAGMAGAHALAGMLVAAWLYMGERALWHALGVITDSLFGRALRVFALLIGADLVGDRQPAGAACRRAGHDAPPIVGVLRHVVVRRGPPRDDRRSLDTPFI
jgi:hypothetical protein